MLPVRGKSAAYLNIESNYYINATISISSDPSDALFRQTYALSIDAIRFTLLFGRLSMKFLFDFP